MNLADLQFPPFVETPNSDWLSFKGIKKHFGAFAALDGIDLQVKRGEFVTLLGPSGCGKTTLLRILAGLEVQDAGTLAMAGRDMGRLPAGKRDYGIVFQSYALFPNLNVGENIAYGLKTTKSEKIKRVGDLLELVGLPGAEAKFPSQLSGGQQQRVALARALATSPSLLLLDEPLSALDAQVREHLQRELKALQRKLGITTIMVTHDQQEALTLSDRIAVMRNGRIEQVGTPEAIYRSPASRFVADFVGHANWLSVEVDAANIAHMGSIELHLAEIMPAGPAQIFIRPEDVVVEPHWHGGQNGFLAFVDAVEFLGDKRRAHLSPCGVHGVKLMADLSPQDMGQSALVPGRIAPVRLLPARIKSFAE